MKKKVMYIILIITVLLIIASSLFVIFKPKDKNNKKNNEYAIKFKEEYEAYNGKSINGKKYQKLDIKEDNPIVYSNYKEIVDIIKNKTGIIYFGFPNCPWCRNAVPVLLDAAKDNDINEIYYLNILEFRDTFEVIDGELTKTKEAQKGYYEILEALDEILDEYIVDDIDTNEKRLYAPTVIFVKKGEIIGYHVATVELNEGQTKYDELTKAQKKELKQIYNYYIEQTFNDYCTDAC